MENLYRALTDEKVASRAREDLKDPKKVDEYFKNYPKDIIRFVSIEPNLQTNLQKLIEKNVTKGVGFSPVMSESDYQLFDCEKDSDEGLQTYLQALDARTSQEHSRSEKWKDLVNAVALVGSALEGSLTNDIKTNYYPSLISLVKYRRELV